MHTMSGSKVAWEWCLDIEREKLLSDGKLKVFS